MLKKFMRWKILFSGYKSSGNRLLPYLRLQRFSTARSEIQKVTIFHTAQLPKLIFSHRTNLQIQYGFYEKNYGTASVRVGKMWMGSFKRLVPMRLQWAIASVCSCCFELFPIRPKAASPFLATARFFRQGIEPRGIGRYRRQSDGALDGWVDGLKYSVVNKKASPGRPFRKPLLPFPENSNHILNGAFLFYGLVYFSATKTAETFGSN